jgi:hypothetical protein
LRREEPDGLAGVTLPKDDLRKEGVIDEPGELNGEKYAKIERTGDGEFRVTLVDA